jgi:hypothetical protein
MAAPSAVVAEEVLVWEAKDKWPPADAASGAGFTVEGEIVRAFPLKVRSSRVLRLVRTLSRTHRP